MRKKVIVCIAIVLTLAGISIVGSYWIITQPVWVVDKQISKNLLDHLPTKNKKIIELIETRGKELAPTYREAVCTEFVINVIDNLDSLTKTEKNDIRIITTEELGYLIATESPVIKGIQTALVNGDKGIAVEENEVIPGDFVQFWNVHQGRERGHCGVVLDIDHNKTITLYSSHPLTDGYGKQEYLWPDKLFFVRLR
jgi:hypothetical protein